MILVGLGIGDVGPGDLDHWQDVASIENRLVVVLLYKSRPQTLGPFLAIRLYGNFKSSSPLVPAYFLPLFLFQLGYKTANIYKINVGIYFILILGRVTYYDLGLFLGVSPNLGAAIFRSRLFRSRGTRAVAVAAVTVAPITTGGVVLCGTSPVLSGRRRLGFDHAQLLPPDHFVHRKRGTVFAGRAAQVEWISVETRFQIWRARRRRRYHGRLKRLNRFVVHSRRGVA